MLMRFVHGLLGPVVLLSAASNLWFVLSIGAVIGFLAPPKWLEMLLSVPTVLAFYGLVVAAFHAVRETARWWAFRSERGESARDDAEPLEDRRMLAFRVSFVGLIAFLAVSLAAAVAGLFLGRTEVVLSGIVGLLSGFPGVYVAGTTTLLIALYFALRSRLGTIRTP